MTSRQGLARFLGAGALAFGVIGIVRPALLARWMDASPEAAREIGFRDLGNGALLLASAGTDPRPAIAQRMLFDVSDAVMYGRGKPGVAAGALGFAALGAYALAGAD